MTANAIGGERAEPRCLRFPSARVGRPTDTLRYCMQLLPFSGCSNSTPSTVPWLDIPLHANASLVPERSGAPSLFGLYHVRSGQRQRSKLFGTGA